MNPVIPIKQKSNHGRQFREFCKNGHTLSETRRRHPGGSVYCYLCKPLDNKKYYNLDPVGARRKATDYRRRVLYGITPAQFEAQLKKQEYKCALCKTEQPGIKGWCADHCHRTMKFRGVLCHYCNSGIGLLKEDTKLLLRAIQYLEEAEKPADAEVPETPAS